MSTYQAHRVDVTALAFDDGGQLLASGSEEGTVDVRAPTSMLVELVCSRVRRNLTLDEWTDAVGTELPYERTCPNLPAGSVG
jgi:hypothetical protein